MKKLLLITALITATFAEPIDDYLKTLEMETKAMNRNFQGFSIKRGEKIFTTESVGKKGKIISCVSCHGKNFEKEGKHFFTGETVDALSRKTNPKAFTKVRHTKKWLRRNFRDVYNRLGTSQEKGDVLLYLLSKAR